MPPVNLECLDNDSQDARVRSQGENFVELEVIHSRYHVTSAGGEKSRARAGERRLVSR